MSNINTYFLQAGLSQAAYGTFLDKTIAIADLINRDTVGMSFSQATQFAVNWQVVAQYTDPVTGVSATVFETKNGGAKYLAIRGTDFEAKDLLADGILATAMPVYLNPQFTALQLKLNAWLGKL
ncbi:MAG: hypothetical protein JNL77_12550 [Nitrosomonas sp.]|nr:hypothetical protein [Nitrosomonas sp.]